MFNVNKVNILTERTSGVLPVIFDIVIVIVTDIAVEFVVVIDIAIELFIAINIVIVSKKGKPHHLPWERLW